MDGIRFVIVWFIALGIVPSVSAEYVFDLVQEDSTVVATLTLEELLSPDPADIVSLTFSDRGQELFGLGSVYSGSFDELSASEFILGFDLEIDGVGLMGRTSHQENHLLANDNNPPPTSLTGIEATQFSIVATDIPDRDRIFLSQSNSDGVIEFGNWVLVPEPECTWMFASLLLLVRVRGGPKPIDRKRLANEQ